MIRAIETIWPWPNGHRFRSRLEARWAVFFDAIGFKFEYELQGYDLGGVCYLPDFYLPDMNTHVEIKPYPSSKTEIEKAERLSIGTKSDVIVVEGDPYFPPAHHFRYHQWGDVWGASELIEVDDIALAKTGHRTDYRHFDDTCYVSHRYYSSVAWVQFQTMWFPVQCASGYEQMFQDNIAPMLTARQARFEHGESPQHARQP